MRSAKVTVQNYYQYRHIEKPGWTLGWAWSSGEIISTMAGALALRQGNCSDFTTQIPHSCEREPRIMDHMPDVAPENRSDSCCRGGVISAWGINTTLSSSSFEMVVGDLGGDPSSISPPQNVTFLGPGPGYTCSPFGDYPPTVFYDTDKRRLVQGHGNQPAHTQVTWLTRRPCAAFRCPRSTTERSPNAPHAAVLAVLQTTKPSLALGLSCNCTSILSDHFNNINCEEIKLTESPVFCLIWVKSVSFYCNDFTNLATELDYMVRCSEHMCPVRVHWHVKNNYREYWRVKLTVSNYHYGQNYTDWNVVVQHPGFGQKVESYSFNSTTLRTIADTGERLVDEVALFWGKPFYNSELLQAVDEGPASVTTDLILKKDLSVFTLNNGWAFPRRIYFNGENCEMPTPEDFPGLPSSASNIGHGPLLLLLILCSTMMTLWL
ncbi:hypothetical protein ACLOJK_027947 [Asimina triloba]